MTVGELKEALKDIPDNLKVLAEGEEADRVIVEDKHYIRIFKSWDMDLVLGSAGLRDNEQSCDRNICLQNEYNNIGCEDCVVTKGENNE